MTVQALWHNDGHSMTLGLNKDEIVIESTSCPRGEECRHEDASCVVEFFLDNYGLDVNVGSCTINGPIEIAWTFIEVDRNLDSGQVWVIPTDDPMFAAWADHQTNA